MRKSDLIGKLQVEIDRLEEYNLHSPKCLNADALGQIAGLIKAINIVRLHEAEQLQDTACDYCDGTGYYYELCTKLACWKCSGTGNAVSAAMGVTGHSTFSGKTEGHATREGASPVTPAKDTLNELGFAEAMKAYNSIAEANNIRLLYLTYPSAGDINAP